MLKQHSGQTFAKREPSMNRATYHRSINGETRLNIALDNIPGAVDYIVSLNPHDFARLKNPMMRRLMSPRISLRRVAAMAHISEAALLQGLAALGGAVPVQTSAVIALSEPLIPPQSPISQPLWLADISDADIPWVDLLPLDDTQGDPFPLVSIAVKGMAPASVLGIRHRWQPQPFYDVWARMGIEWFARQVSADEWHIYVFKPPTFGRKYI
jgi:hypothetical protein